MKSKSRTEKLNSIKDIIEYCYTTCQFNFYDKEFLEVFDKDDYKDYIEEDEDDD